MLKQRELTGIGRPFMDGGGERGDRLCSCKKDKVWTDYLRKVEGKEVTGFARVRKTKNGQTIYGW